VIIELIGKLYAAIDRAPTKRNLFTELSSFMNNLTESRVDTCQPMFFDESVMCPVQNYVAVLHTFPVMLFTK
jgi:hypothetical protein